MKNYAYNYKKVSAAKIRERDLPIVHRLLFRRREREKAKSLKAERNRVLFVIQYHSNGVMQLYPIGHLAYRPLTHSSISSWGSYLSSEYLLGKMSCTHTTPTIPTLDFIGLTIIQFPVHVLLEKKALNISQNALWGFQFGNHFHSHYYQNFTLFIFFRFLFFVFCFLVFCFGRKGIKLLLGLVISSVAKHFLHLYRFCICVRV